MLSITELGAVLGLTRDRAKQIVAEEYGRNSALDVDKSSRAWDIGPSTVRSILTRRNIQLPKRKIAVIGTQKGGVGKTTLAINIAGELGRIGYRVLVIDTDPEAHATNFLAREDFDRLKAKTISDAYGEKIPLQAIVTASRFRGVDLIPSGLRNFNFDKVVGQKTNPKTVIRKELEKLDEYNVILLEVSPSMSLLSTSCYLAADVIAMPVLPDAFSLESIPLTMRSISEIAEEFEKPLSELNFRIILNQVRPHATTHDALKFLLENYEQYLLPIHIKHSVEVIKCNNAGVLVSEGKVSEVSNAFKEIAYFIGEFPIRSLSNA